MFKNSNKRLNIWLSLHDKFNYSEFIFACDVAGCEAMPMFEFAQRVGILQVAITEYPDMRPQQAHSRFLLEHQFVASPFVVGIEKEMPTSRNNCCCDGEPSSLSLKDLALNAGLAVSKYVSSGMQNVDAMTRDQRLDACNKCEHLAGSRCSKCGCFVKIKSWMATEDCPDGRW